MLTCSYNINTIIEFPINHLVTLTQSEKNFLLFIVNKNYVPNPEISNCYPNSERFVGTYPEAELAPMIFTPAPSGSLRLL